MPNAEETPARFRKRLPAPITYRRVERSPELQARCRHLLQIATAVPNTVGQRYQFCQDCGKEFGRWAVPLPQVGDAK